MLLKQTSINQSILPNMPDDHKITKLVTSIWYNLWCTFKTANIPIIFNMDDITVIMLNSIKSIEIGCFSILIVEILLRLYVNVKLIFLI